MVFSVVPFDDGTSLVEPTIYRAVIDDVIANIKPEFDDFGVSEEVLAELQSVSSPSVHVFLTFT